MVICNLWIVYMSSLVDHHLRIHSSMGRLGSSVGWASHSWFWLRSWSQGCGMEPHAGCGVCLRFSLPHSLPLPHWCAHVLFPSFSNVSHNTPSLLPLCWLCFLCRDADPFKGATIFFSYAMPLLLYIGLIWTGPQIPLFWLQLSCL